MFGWIPLRLWVDLSECEFRSRLEVLVGLHCSSYLASVGLTTCEPCNAILIVVESLQFGFIFVFASEVCDKILWGWTVLRCIFLSQVQLKVFDSKILHCFELSLEMCCCWRVRNCLNGLGISILIASFCPEFYPESWTATSCDCSNKQLKFRLFLISFLQQLWQQICTVELSS